MRLLRPGDVWVLWLKAIEDLLEGFYDGLGAIGPRGCRPFTVAGLFDLAAGGVPFGDQRSTGPSSLFHLTLEVVDLTLGGLLSGQGLLGGLEPL